MRAFVEAARRRSLSRKRAIMTSPPSPTAARPLRPVRRTLCPGSSDGAARRTRTGLPHGARRIPAFHAELDDLLHNYAGRPTPLYFAKRLTETLGGAQDLPQARRPAPHRRAQDQQLPRPGAARAAHGQDAASSPKPARASTASPRLPSARCSASIASSTWAKRTCAASASTSSACACWARRWSASPTAAAR